ncbi:MAG TPA: sulfotransferase [Acetobacteraceae bacterium]|nr:sulfotransferase [Acetobacteraceae bacterium]
MPPGFVTDSLVETVILVLGAPRSGTTWLAKILDSHPDVLYRHEPDEVIPAPAELEDAALRRLIAAWIAERGLRSAGKRPFFPKSWQSAPARLLRTGLAHAVTAGERVLGASRLAAAALPDLARDRPARAVIKSVRWSEGAPLLTRSLPASRTFFILRHPCGQVASVMRGTGQRRFELREAGTDMPFHEGRAIAQAAAFGLDATEFQALPDAAKYAWDWVAFNAPVLDAPAEQPNLRVVVYEDLCARPIPMAREIMAFAGLSWTSQTERFVSRSTTHEGRAGYYGVFRNALAAAESWRGSMTQADQAAVRSVVQRSGLGRFWPDF